MVVYLAYYEDDKNVPMSSSFGWSPNEYLARLYLQKHRLSRDKDCKPRLVKLICNETDGDDIHGELRDINFYPFTPIQDYDTEIRVIHVEDADTPWDKDLAVVTTYDSVYGVIGSSYMTPYEKTEDDYMQHCDDMEAADRICRIIHWLVTGGIVRDKQTSNILKKASERIYVADFTSYKEFNAIKYCIATGYLLPL